MEPCDCASDGGVVVRDRLSTPRWGRWLAAIVLASLVAVLAAGCGSSSGSSTNPQDLDALIKSARSGDVSLLLKVGHDFSGLGKFKAYEVPTEAMSPAIAPGDKVLANLSVYAKDGPKSGDIVVFRPTTSANLTCGGSATGSEPFVKRVIGVSGDHVEVRNGQTLVNGRVFAVKNAQVPTYPPVTFPVVPKGKVLVFGDRRNESCDSHEWPDPFVPVANVLGRIDAIYFPADHARVLSGP